LSQLDGGVKRAAELKAGFVAAVQWQLITSEAAWRLECGDLIEVEIKDGLEGITGCAIASSFGKRGKPLGVFALQCDQFGHGVAPALWSAAPIGRSTVADNHGTGVAGAVAGLTLGAGECSLASGPASGLAVLGHDACF